jgi:hypothetical protein
MTAQIKSAFKALKEYFSERLSGKVAKFYQHWEKLDEGGKNTAVFLPDKHASADGRMAFDIVIWISVFENNYDAIADSQMEIAEALYDAVYPGSDMPPEILSADIGEIEYFDPEAGAPHVGLLRAVIKTTLDYIDDCG